MKTYWTPTAFKGLTDDGYLAAGEKSPLHWVGWVFPGMDNGHEDELVLLEKEVNMSKEKVSGRDQHRSSHIKTPQSLHF